MCGIVHPAEEEERQKEPPPGLFAREEQDDTCLTLLCFPLSPRNADGSYLLTFRNGNRTETVPADRVVLALPFSILRTLDYSQAGFRPLKVRAIREQGMGANAKLHLQFRTRHWNGPGNSGDTVSDRGYQDTWEATRAQAGSGGILVNYTGGNVTRAAAATSPQTVLSRIEAVLPGLTAQWNGKSQLEYWPGYALTRGSYSFWKVGQYVAFAGVEGEIEGHCHFCGEHTSLDSQGYLNGAVETGERAAAEVAKELVRADHLRFFRSAE